MVAGRVNETLSRQHATKGPDGLTEAERRAYAICKHLSCQHESCYKRYLMNMEKQAKECKPLMQRWRTCFDAEMSRSSEQPQLSSEMKQSHR
jgi:undecaprenyl pyrophosphate synthase